MSRSSDAEAARFDAVSETIFRRWIDVVTAKGIDGARAGRDRRRHPDRPGPNAFRCFGYLGVGNEARAIAVYIDKPRLLDARTAEDITLIPFDAPFRRFYGTPYTVVDRADLHGVLLKFCQDSPLVDIRTGHVVTG